MVISLKNAIGDDATAAFLKEAIANFTCKDNDVETFLKAKAFDFERRDKSRTYLVFTDKDSVLLGYFTLTLNALPFRTGVSKNTIKLVDGFSKDVQAVGIIMIGQFGKDQKYAEHIKGTQLLDICLEAVYKAQDIAGGRFVMLECLEIPQVVSFYEKNGFVLLQRDEKDKYLQMIRRL